MPNRGAIISLVFLALGILLNIVPLGSRQDLAEEARPDSAVTEDEPPIALPVGSSLPPETPAPEREDTTRTTLEASPGQRADITLESYSLKKESATRWKLPNRMTEISGLAMTPDNRLLTHNDEAGVIYEVNYTDGAIVKAFGLANRSTVIADDFEGIAVADGRIYLVTSTGRIYECSEGADGERVPFEVYRTDVGHACEIEGLAYDPGERVLLVLCKNPLSPELDAQVVIYRWSVDTKQIVEGGRIVFPLSEFVGRIGSKKFQPSGIERHPLSGNYFLVAARQSAIAEVTPAGQVVSARRLPQKWHRQPEGITFGADNTLIVSDEGSGKRARLTLYSVSAP